MSRWFRAYDDALNDPKVQGLPPALFKFWFNVLCVASKNDGVIPSLAELKTALKARLDHVEHHVKDLISRGLIDEINGRLEPHNWRKRQYKSDVSTPRVQAHRKAKRNVSETPPETEQNTETEKIRAEATASDAGASRDVRRDLFDTGLKALARITGKTPDSCRSLVGKWLKSVNDEAIHVLGAIEDAERNRVADPVAWINRILQPRTKDGRKNNVIDAADRLVENLRRFERNDEPDMLPDLRGGTIAPDVRVLSPK